MVSLLRLVLLCTVSVLVVAAQSLQLQCHEYSTALVSSVSDPQALRVQIFENSTSGFTKLIEGHSLPSECAADFHKCNLEKISDRYLTVPATGHIVILNLHSTNSSPEVVELDCNPTNIFFDEAAHLWVTCIYGPEGFLRHLAFTVSLSDEGISLTRNHRRSSPPINISPGGFSETLVVSGCSDVRLYTVIDNQIIWHFPISMYVTPQFEHTDVFENCDEVAYLEHFNRKKSFTIHCSNGISVRYRTCNNHFQYFNLSGDGTQYSCPDNTVIYGPDYITFRNQTVDTYFNYSFGAIKHGACQGDYFTVIAGDGSLNAIHLGTGVATTIARSVCEGGGNDSCVRPSFSPISSAPGFLVYDTAESLLKSVSELEDCESPVTETYADSSVPRPSLMSITDLAGAHDCQCSIDPIPATTMETTMETTTSVIVTTANIDVELKEGEKMLRIALSVSISIGAVILITGTIVTCMVISLSFVIKKSWDKRRSRNLRGFSFPGDYSNGGSGCLSESDSASDQVEEDQVEDDKHRSEEVVSPDESTDSTAVTVPRLDAVQEHGQDEWAQPSSLLTNGTLSTEANSTEVMQMFFPSEGPSSPLQLDNPHAAVTCMPLVAEGSGFDAHLVQSKDTPVPHTRLTAHSLVENARRLNTEDRGNDIDGKIREMLRIQL